VVVLFVCDAWIFWWSSVSLGWRESPERASQHDRGGGPPLNFYDAWVNLLTVRQHYNGTRLPAGIGYVTPHDEDEGRGPAIRKSREADLETARLRRLTYHR
jgi:hypothetical protein